MPADLIIFGEDWGSYPTSTQNLVRYLAEDRRIIYVNSLGLRRPRLNAHDLNRIVDKAGQVVRGRRGTPIQDVKQRPPETVTVIAPVALPFPGSKLAFKFNGAALQRQLGPKIQQCKLDRPILWVTVPTALAVAGRLGERALVYYCADDFGALAGVDHADVLAIEDQLVERADLILACSQELVAKFPAEKTMLLPHGVDVELFTKPVPPADDLPTGRPIAGYYGAFLDRIDLPLLKAAIETLSDWDFVFLGKIAQAEQDAFAGLDNVRFLGAKAHETLPRYVQHWTVSLLPFADTAMVRAMNPLKLREYLAAGTPIATTDFPALAPYRDLVCLRQGDGPFADVIRQAQADTARNGERKASMQSESWRARAQQASDALARLG